MVTTLDYAILSAAAYNANRGKDNEINVIGTGFIVLPESIPNNSTDPLSGGFSATAYQKGNEIVIAYEGTDFLLGSNTSPSNLGQTAADITAY